jgi:hypothetical protein
MIEANLIKRCSSQPPEVKRVILFTTPPYAYSWMKILTDA